MDLSSFNLYFICTYLLSVLLVFLYLCRPKENQDISTMTDKGIIIGFSILYILLFGFRGRDVGADTAVYINLFTAINSNHISIVNMPDYFFVILSKVVYYFSGNASHMLLTVSIIYFYLLYAFINNYSLKKRFILFFIFTSMFFFKSMGINIIRQGLAEMFFLVSLTHSLKKDKKKYILFSFLSVICHTTLIIPIIVFLISKRMIHIKPDQLLLLFLSGIILGFFNISLLSIMNNNIIFLSEHYLDYFNSQSFDELYKIGFKPQFVLFNTLFFILGYAILKYYSTYVTLFYKRIFITYTLLSIILFLMFNIPYSDRIGLFSWCLTPTIAFPYFTIYKKNMIVWRWGIFIFCVILFFTFN